MTADIWGSISSRTLLTWLGSSISVSAAPAKAGASRKLAVSMSREHQRSWNHRPVVRQAHCGPQCKPNGAGGQRAIAGGGLSDRRNWLVDEDRIDQLI